MAAKQKSDTSVVVAADVQPSVVDETVQPTEVASEVAEVSNQLTPIVVCAYAGTEDIMRKVWGKYCSKPFTVLTAQPGDEFSHLLTLAIADNTVADEFVMVMPNTVPCSEVSAELYLPTVLVDANGKAHYDHRLPMVIRKESAVEMLGESAPIGSQEDFIKAYAEKYWGRPVQVSLHFGNYVTTVLRGTPCMNAVAEGLVRRKFVSANDVGFAAIEKLIEQVLL